MKILVQNLETQKASNNIKILEIDSTEINTSNGLYIISNNEIPLIKFTDTEETFLIKELNSKLLQNNSETLLNITDEDLVGLSSAGNTTPTYKVYTALLSQTGTNAPVATVLENTLGGNVVWSYDNVGYYIGTYDGLFIANKTTILMQSTAAGSDYQTTLYDIYTPNIVYIQIYDHSSNNNINDSLNNTSIEIRVYN